MAGQIGDADYFVSEFEKPRYPDTPGTLAQGSRSGNHIVDKYNDMKREQALIDVSDIGIAGPAMAARGIASSFARPAVNPANVFRANPNLGNNVAFQAGETGVPQVASQGAQDIAESIGRTPTPKMNFNAERIVEPYVVPSSKMKGYDNMDSFDTLRKSGVMDEMGEFPGGKASRDAFWNANPKLRDKVAATEKRDGRAAGKADDAQHARWEAEDYVDKWEAKGRVPHDKPKNKKQRRQNQLVQERLDRMEELYSLPDEAFEAHDAGSIGEAFMNGTL